jgi:L-ribulose-5-phosphate 3-epimerase
MKTCGSWPIGVCSWSLQRPLKDVAETLEALGTRHVHLDIGPACAGSPDAYLEEVQRYDWSVSATMLSFAQEDYSTLERIRETGGIVPDACWPVNRERFLQAIRATAALQVPYLSSHFGFLDPAWLEAVRVLGERVRWLADAAQESGVMLLMETGQEAAPELRHFLEALDHPALGVNFDPANMILYDMGDPVEAVRVLAPWIRHVHIKDALRTRHPGEWGEEVVWGEGDVAHAAFLQALVGIGYTGVVSVEREAGPDRRADIATAVDRLAGFQP